MEGQFGASGGGFGGAGRVAWARVGYIYPEEVIAHSKYLMVA